MVIYERGSALARGSFEVNDKELEVLSDVESNLWLEFEQKRDGDAQARWDSARLDLALAKGDVKTVQGLRALGRRAYEYSNLEDKK